MYEHKGYNHAHTRRVVSQNMKQAILSADNNYRALDSFLESAGVRRPLLVCGSAIRHNQGFREHLDTLESKGIQFIRFSDYEPNPLYESVVRGVKLFKAEGCDGIIAVGGGSAIDVAKCVKLYSNMDEGADYLSQKAVPNSLHFLAVPTTAGTGSEATSFAVIYHNGEKLSVADDSCIPEAVLFDSSFLETLPLYQKKATALDALCHSLESFWSVNSNDESRSYSREALGMVLEELDGYLENNGASNDRMLRAANIAGKAINISKTTAGHAMCYKLTTLFGIAHGHAAILCNAKLFPWMTENLEKCVDPRGKQYLLNIFEEIASCFGCSRAGAVGPELEKIVDRLGFEAPAATEEDLKVLVNSVNLQRLKNNPVKPEPEDIEFLYRKIVINRKE